MVAKKETKKIPLWQRKWFKEKNDTIFIIPVNIWGWIALVCVILFIFAIAYVNFSYADSAFKDSVSFVVDLVLAFGLALWFFDKKSFKKEDEK